MHSCPLNYYVMRPYVASMLEATGAAEVRNEVLPRPSTALPAGMQYIDAHLLSL